MNRTIEELKLNLDIRAGAIDCLEVMMERQKWYMKKVADFDDDGNCVYDIPDADSPDFAYFKGYQDCIDAVYKMLKKGYFE